jgi:transmembrane sensor
MERSDFHRLMERYVKGDVTEQEKLKIETWLNVLKAENISDAQLSKEDEDALFLQLISKINNTDKIVAFRPSGWTKKNKTKWALGIAAGIVMVAAFAFALLNSRQQSSSTLEVVASEDTEKIILNDGSIAWLKKGSKFVYYQKTSDNLRYGELQGEGLFEIAKDATHPFVLQCGETSIRVVGTSFKLRSSDNGIELWVLTGHVKVSSALKSDIIDVVANQKLMITKATSSEATTIDASERQSIMVNTEYDMLFDDIPLATVLIRLSDKFNVDVRFDNNSIERCKITADFTDHSLESTLTMISEITDLHYKKDGNRIVIEGDGCKIP